MILFSWYIFFHFWFIFHSYFYLQVVLLWSCFLIFGCVKIFQWCTFSWGEIAFCAVFLALIMILMQILIVFSQSEHSTPPKISQPDPLKDVLLQKWADVKSIKVYLAHTTKYDLTIDKFNFRFSFFFFRL